MKIEYDVIEMPFVVTGMFVAPILVVVTLLIWGVLYLVC